MKFFPTSILSILSLLATLPQISATPVNVTEELQNGSYDINVGAFTISGTPYAGLTWSYKDGTGTSAATASSTLWLAHRGFHQWAFKHAGGSGEGDRWTMRLDPDHRLLLYKNLPVALTTPATIPTPSITLDPNGVSKITQPASALLDNDSILNLSLADSRYVKISSGGSIAAGGIAIGTNNFVADAALALGTSNNSSATGGVTIGNWNSALDSYGFAGGFHSTASGSGSVALGIYSYATKYCSVALGNSRSYGYMSTASGDADAIGEKSSAFGHGRAEGTHSIATGASTALGGFSSAFGRSDTSLEWDTTAGGYSHANGYASTAFGVSTSGGVASTSLGASTVGATGNAATALGNSAASGDRSVALGNAIADNAGATASGYSKAHGIGSTASGTTEAFGDYSTAFGRGLKASSYVSTVVGHFNDNESGVNTTTWVPTENLFVVGNGTSDAARSNALVVQKNGNATFKGVVHVAPGGDIPMFVP